MTALILELINLLKAGDRRQANALKDKMLGAAIERRDRIEQDLVAKVFDYYCAGYDELSEPWQASLKGKLIDECSSEIQQGVSLVTCCMNREENLLKALTTWLAIPNLNEIVIVDWSSKQFVSKAISDAGLHSDKITYLRVEGQSRWILSYAYNAGFRLAQFSHILKCDADIKLKPNFLADNTIKPGEFRTGNWRTAEKGQEHINGFVYIHRADLLAVKGFNEHITTYGWDDDDLYERLLEQGFKRLEIAPATIWHIPHGDEQRLSPHIATSQGLSLRDVLAKDPAHSIRTNRFLAALMPEWNVDRHFVDIRIEEFKDGVLIARQTEDSWHITPPHILEFCEYASCCKWLSWRYGGGSFWLDQAKMRMFCQNVSEKSPAKLIIDLLLRASGTDVFEERTIILVDIKDTVSDHDDSGLYLALSEIARSLRRNLFIHRRRPSESSSLWNYPQLIFIRDGLDLSEAMTVSIEELRDAIADERGGATVDRQVLAIYGNEICLLEQCRRAKDDWQRPTPMVRRRKRLYIDAQHGLGNRLRAIASAAAIAKATNRELRVIWRSDFHCEARFPELFESDLMVSDSWEEADAEGVKIYNYMEIEAKSRKDEAIITDVGEDIYVRSAYTLNHPKATWVAENDFLAQLVPAKRVRDLVQSVPHDYIAALHVRCEGAAGNDLRPYDHISNWTAEGHAQINYWRSKSSPRAFLIITDKLLRDQAFGCAFLATDTEVVYQMFLDRYGSERVRYLKRNVFDRSKEQALYALADALLLAKATKIYGSNWSSFTELAMRFANGRASLEVAGVDFGQTQECE